MSRILDHVNFNSIKSYIRTDYDSSKYSNLVFVFDNMILSNLALSARTYPHEFNLMLDTMSLRDAIVLIPEIILEESAGNNGMTPERYQEYYEELFKALSQYTEIYVVPFEATYEIIEEGAASSSEAFAQFQLVAKLLNKTNKAIESAIESSTDIAGIEQALTTASKDAGERVIHLLTCALLINGVSTVRVMSNELKGVYNIRYLSSQDETMREILRLSTQDAFLKYYELESFDCILAKVLQSQKGKWSHQQHLEFLNRHRVKTMKNREVRYMIPPTFSDKRQLMNDEFVNLILSNEEAIITF